jgi:hypothetical protein
MTTNLTFAKINKITNFELLANILDLENKDTLVVFDIDDVVMMPADSYSMSRNPYRKKLWKEMKERLSKEEIEFLYSIITTDAKWQLVDSKILDILGILKKLSIPTIALSSFSTGKYGQIEKREEIRLRDLASLDIDFFELSPFQDTFTMNQLSGEDGVPMIKDGVILTAELGKDLVLDHVLKYKNYKPKKIIFIDDTLKHLESVEKLCDSLKIDFLGFHYVAVSTLPPPDNINEQQEKRRLQILEKEHRWVVDF